MTRRLVAPMLTALAAAGIAGAAADAAPKARETARLRAAGADAAVAAPRERRVVGLAASSAAPVAPAAAARVRQMVVFRDGHALTKRVSTAATTVNVAGRRCAVGDGTALAALGRSKPGRLRIRDFGSCSSSPRDAAGLLVTGIGGDRNRGQRGWVYKVGRRAATAGAGDPSGPFGHGRLRAGQRVTWFYCVRAADCQRTLVVRATPTTDGIVATVRAYDDAGDGVPVEGASVTAGGVTGLTAVDGRVQIALAPGTHRVVARKEGLVRSFTDRVEVP